VCALSGEGISAEDSGPNALFKLSALKGPQVAATVGEAEVPDEEDAAAEPESSKDDSSASSLDEDSDEAQRCVHRTHCCSKYCRLYRSLA
jgi:hypothetical protein